MSALATRFESLWNRANLRADSSIFDRLRAAYGEPARAYHNLSHIAHMLDEFDAQRALAEDPLAVELAIWFHDAIYDARAKDNEERSALLSREILTLAGAASALVQTVEALILVTRHQQPPVTRDEQLLVDCDLAILGQSTDRFDAYETAIRREYDWVLEDAYRAGRSKVLEHFLARPFIFSLPVFHSRYEQAARENLARSLRALAGS